MRFFQILDPEGKYIDNPSIENLAQFFLAVVVAKMKKHLMESRKKIEDVLSKVRVKDYKYFELLSLKYHLSNETCLTVVSRYQVEEIELLTEFLVTLSWSEDRQLKDNKVSNLVIASIAKDILSSFAKYDYWFIRYKSCVLEGLKKAKDTTMRDEDAENSKKTQSSGTRRF